MKIELTDKMILEEISELQGKINAARQKLADLPNKFIAYDQHRKRERLRRELTGEIESLKIMISYAKQAIDE